MNKPENKYDELIDFYYNELPDETSKNSLNQENEDNKVNEFANKLNSALCKMDILKTDTSTLDINVLEIIQKGEFIKQKRRNSFEFLTFISLSLLIISSLILTTFYFGQKFFIYYELLTFIFIPILMIPLAKISETGGN